MALVKPGDLMGSDREELRRPDPWSNGRISAAAGLRRLQGGTYSCYRMEVAVACQLLVTKMAHVSAKEVVFMEKKLFRNNFFNPVFW